jgi:hypothetical protein
MRKFLVVGLLALGAGWLPGCALDTVTSGRVVVSNGRNSVDVRFSERDRAIIEQYFAKQKPKKAPPGLAKRESLPPGLGKRDRLPPGLRARGLPGDLTARLLPVPADYVRLVIGADVVLMNRNTRVMVDIIRGVAG